MICGFSSSRVVTEKYCVTPGKELPPPDGASVADAAAVEGAADFEETVFTWDCMTGVTGVVAVVGVGMTASTE